MACRLKGLGLVLLGLCALGGVAAQGASAAEEHSFTVSQAPAWITAEADPTAPIQTFSVLHTAVECKKLHADTTINAPKLDTLTILPQWEECHSGSVASDAPSRVWPAAG